MTYLIESMGTDNRWFIVGSDKSSGWAQHYMRGYQRTYPSKAFRVVESKTRRIVVLHDPIANRAA